MLPSSSNGACQNHDSICTEGDMLPTLYLSGEDDVSSTITVGSGWDDEASDGTDLDPVMRGFQLLQLSSGGDDDEASTIDASTIDCRDDSTTGYSDDESSESSSSGSSRVGQWVAVTPDNNPWSPRLVMFSDYNFAPGFLIDLFAMQTPRMVLQRRNGRGNRDGRQQPDWMTRRETADWYVQPVRLEAAIMLDCMPRYGAPRFPVLRGDPDYHLYYNSICARINSFLHEPHQEQGGGPGKCSFVPSRISFKRLSHRFQTRPIVTDPGMEIVD